MFESTSVRSAPLSRTNAPTWSLVAAPVPISLRTSGSLERSWAASASRSALNERIDDAWPAWLSSTVRPSPIRSSVCGSASDASRVKAFSESTTACRVVALAVERLAEFGGDRVQPVGGHGTGERVDRGHQILDRCRDGGVLPIDHGSLGEVRAVAAGGLQVHVLFADRRPVGHDRRRGRRNLRAAVVEAQFHADAVRR